MKCSPGISNFLEEISSLYHSIVFLYFFALITEKVFLMNPCYSFFFFILLLLFTLKYCIGLAIHQHASAMGVYMFPILNPPHLPPHTISLSHSLLFFGTLPPDEYIFPFFLCLLLPFSSKQIVRLPQTDISPFCSSYCWIQFSSVAQSCPTLWDPMNYSMLGLPVHHQLPEFTQTHVHWVSDAIQPSHPLSAPSPLAPESFPMSQLFAWGGQSTGVSALASFLSKKSQGWSPSEWTGWISLQSKGLSRVFSNTTVQKHQFFRAQPSLQSNSHIHTWPQEKP